LYVKIRLFNGAASSPTSFFLSISTVSVILWSFCLAILNLNLNLMILLSSRDY
jgi:hypothetical protein